MERPHNIVIVGEENSNQAILKTTLEPTHIKEKIGIALTSIFHGEIFNINETNNKISYLQPDPELSEISGGIVRGSLPLVTGSLPQKTELLQSKSLEIPIGYYPSVISILEKISISFKRLHLFNEEFYDDKEPEFICNLLPNGYIECFTKNIHIQVREDNSPWSLIGIDNNLIYGENQNKVIVKDRTFSKDLVPAFLYVNIVESSYINGKLSRVLSTIPIRMKSDWSFYEFSHLNYVPISVKEFTNIYVEIRDIGGNYVKFNPAYKTIITLQTKAINTSGKKDE